MELRSSFLGIGILIVAALSTRVSPDQTPVSPQATEILKAAGVSGGLIVHLGCGDGRLTAALHAGDGYLVQGWDREAQNVAKARAYIQSLGSYGPVSADRLTGDSLPYIDNFANLVVAEDLRWDLDGGGASHPGTQRRGLYQGWRHMDEDGQALA